MLTGRLKQVLFAGGCICSVAGIAAIWKDLVKGKDLSPDTPKKLEGKVYLVTGANSGIGREVAYQLAKRKAKVYMLCRDMEKCETERKEIVLSTRNKYVYCRLCDLASNSSIREFVNEFKKSQNRVDGLVNNAGVMNAPRAVSRDGVEIHLATNHLGHFLLTYLLLDTLKTSAPSRIVYLINPDYRKANIDLTDLNLEKRFNKAEAFSQSQLANMLIVQEFADQLKGQGVTCNAVYPGVVSGTGIKRHMGIDKSVVGRLMSRPLLWIATKPPEKAAKNVLHALLAAEVEQVSGKLFSNMEERQIEEKAQDRVLGKKLFAVDEYWTDLKSREELKLVEKS